MCTIKHSEYNREQRHPDAVRCPCHSADGGLVTNVPTIPGGYVTTFAVSTAMVRGQPKARIGAVNTIGTAWIYDQP